MKARILLSLALSSMVLVGCGEGGGGGDEGLVKIRVDSQYGKGMQTAFESIAKEFNKKYEGKIEVEIHQISGGYPAVLKAEKADLNVNNDEWGDLVCAYPDHVADYLEYGGKVVDLDKFIYSKDESIALDQEDDIEDFTDAARSYFKVSYPASGTYAVPYSISTECMYYNPVILGKIIPGVNNGEPIDEEYMNSFTWDELFENFCPKFIEYNKTAKLIDTKDDDYCVLAYDDDSNTFITLCEQYGYGYTSLDAGRNPSLDYNTPEVKAMLKKWNGYYKAHYVSTTGSNSDSRPSDDYFEKSKALLCIGSTGGLTYHDEVDTIEVHCAKIPQADNSLTYKDKAILQGGSWCILAHNSSDNEARQKAAWLFYKYLINEDNSTYWSTSTGYAPMRESVYKGEAWAEISDLRTYEGTPCKENLFARNAAYLTQVKDMFFTNVVFKGSSTARTQVGGMFGSVLSATETGNALDTKIQTLINQAITNTLMDM